MSTVHLWGEGRGALTDCALYPDRRPEEVAAAVMAEIKRHGHTIGRVGTLRTLDGEVRGLDYEVGVAPDFTIMRHAFVTPREQWPTSPPDVTQRPDGVWEGA